MSDNPQPRVHNAFKAKNFLRISGSITLFDKNIPSKKYKQFHVNEGKGCFEVFVLNIPNIEKNIFAVRYLSVCEQSRFKQDP